MIRFLYIGPFRFPEGDAAASRVLNNARIFRDLGHRVHILSFGGQYRTEDKIPFGYMYDGMMYIITNDIDTHSTKERITRYITPYSNARAYLEQHKSDYDVIITYNTTLPFNLYLQRFARKNKKKLILDITEWPASNESPGGAWLPFYWMSEFNMRIVQKRFKNIIPISNYLRDYYSQQNNVLLPPLINLSDKKWNSFEPVNNPLIEDFEGLKVIFAGNPAKKDLLANLISAAIEILKDNNALQIVVLGVNPENAVNFCSKESLEKYKSNLVFVGRVPQKVVPSYYQLCDFSAIIREPSRKNMAGFPTKMAESMAAGCPVLLNTTSDLGDYAKDGVNAKIINDYSVESITQGLRELMLLERFKIEEMKHNARLTGKNSFDYIQYRDVVDCFIKNLR